MANREITETEWGWLAGPEDAPVSLALVWGQHGDEYNGAEAGATMMDMLRAWARGDLWYRLDNCPTEDGDYEWSRSGRTDNMRLLCTYGLNPHGFSRGRRFCRDHDLNRQWPDMHPIVEPVWDAICDLPGQVYVVDVHGTWKDRDGDQLADTHVYATSSCATLIRDLMPEMRIVDTPDDERKTLEGEAFQAGYWATTLEIGRNESHPGWTGCLFLDDLVCHLSRLASR